MGKRDGEEEAVEHLTRGGGGWCGRAMLKFERKR